jgi:hypothetical protein
MQLAFMNLDLVPKHDDLDVPVRLGSSGRHHEAENATQADVQE